MNREVRGTDPFSFDRRLFRARMQACRRNTASPENHILRHLAHSDYVAANIPELLRQFGLTPNRQQELQRALRVLEQAGRIARIRGNRYILSGEADLIPGRIRINRAGNDPKLKLYRSWERRASVLVPHSGCANLPARLDFDVLASNLPSKTARVDTQA